MLDPVVVPTLYFLSVLEVTLQALVFLYAYKITKITGSFRSWTLIIIAFAMLTVQNVISLVFSLSLPADQLSTLIQSVGVMSIFLGQAVNLAASVALFLGFFGLAHRFQNQSKGA